VPFSLFPPAPFTCHILFQLSWWSCVGWTLTAGQSDLGLGL
jgi:hypothetical protein